LPSRNSTDTIARIGPPHRKNFNQHSAGDNCGAFVWGLRYAATPATRGRSILALDFFREQIPSSHSPRVEKERSNKETRKVAQIEFDRLVNCFVTNPDSNRRENYENASD
jgi:hypothetical protein